MTSRKTVGYFFIVISIILAFAIVGQLPALFKTFAGVFAMLTGVLDSYSIGKVLGSTCYWIFHIGITILFWSSGRKRIKKVVPQVE